MSKSENRSPQEIIADLELKLAKSAKVNKALKDRVKRSVRTMENSYTLFENNILLQAAVEDKTAALEIAKNDAESSSRAKSEFLANMSHELRTPLHSILAYAQFGLRDAKPEPADIRAYFEYIHSGGELLLTLLNDLLDLAKFESGKMSFEALNCSLLDLMEASAAEFDSQAAMHHATVVLDFAMEDQIVNLDPTRFQQLLRNLISNALKYSPEGGEVQVRTYLDEGIIRIEVLDEGMGIPENELEAIFDKFIQSSKTKSGAGGTGLGLAICREITTAFNGRIYAANRPTGGAILTVELPVTVEDAILV